MSDADFIQQSYEARFGRKMTYKTAAGLRNYDNFETQIDRFVVDTEQKLMTVVRFALQDLTEDANTAKPKGRLPKRTGFLQHSAGAAINQRPVGKIRGDKKKTYSYDATSVIAVIANLKFGDTFYYGWTAEYAKYMEARNGFLEGAIMKWQSFVDKAVSRLR